MPPSSAAKLPAFTPDAHERSPPVEAPDEGNAVVAPRVELRLQQRVNHDAAGGRDELPLVSGPTRAPFGAWVERLGAEALVKDGKGVMVDYVYLDGAKFQPPAAEIKKLRGAP